MGGTTSRAGGSSDGPGAVSGSRKLESLDDAECRRLLASCHLGRVGLIDQGDPVVVPVHYLFHEGAVIFQTAVGGLLDPANASTAMAFEIDATDAVFHSGWSVLVRGIAEGITDRESIARLCVLPLRPWVSRDHHRWVRLWPREITGRRIPKL